MGKHYIYLLLIRWVCASGELKCKILKTLISFEFIWIESEFLVYRLEKLLVVMKPMSRAELFGIINAVDNNQCKSFAESRTRIRRWRGYLCSIPLVKGAVVSIDSQWPCGWNLFERRVIVRFFVVWKKTSVATNCFACGAISAFLLFFSFCIQFLKTSAGISVKKMR